MNVAAKPLLSVVCNCLCALSAFWVVTSFVRFNEVSSQYKLYVEAGVISRATVTEKNLGTSAYQSIKGKPRNAKLKALRVRHVQKSPVRFVDLTSKMETAQLPVAPKPTGNSSIDLDFVGVIFVSTDQYDRIRVNDELIVVSTPYEPKAPVLVSDVMSFSPSPFYVQIGIALFLSVILWFVGRKFRSTNAPQQDCFDGRPSLL